MARKAAVQRHATLTISNTTMGCSRKRSIRIVREGMSSVTQIRERIKIRPPIPPRGRGRRSVVLGLSSKLDSHGVNTIKRKPVAQISRVLCKQSEITGFVVFHEMEEFHKGSLQISIFFSCGAHPRTLLHVGSSPCFPDLFCLSCQIVCGITTPAQQIKPQHCTTWHS